MQRLHQGKYLEFLLTGGSGHRGEGNPNGFLFASSGAYLWATLCVMWHDGMCLGFSLNQHTGWTSVAGQFRCFLSMSLIAWNSRQTCGVMSIDGSASMPNNRRNRANLSNHPATRGTDRRLQAVLQEPSLSVAAVHQRLPGRVEAPTGTQGSRTPPSRQS